MNCFINRIIIFNKNNEKRSVELTSGLNIITGNSKTGKSSLIEIVDYCLCSKTSNIPLGTISEFAYLFVVIFKLPNKFIIIGRKVFMEGGNTKVFVKIESDEKIINRVVVSIQFFK